MDINDGDIKSYGSSFPSNGTLNLSFEDTCTGIFNAWENVSSGVTLLYEKFPNKITLTINGDFVNDNNTTDTLRLTNVVYSAPI